MSDLSPEERALLRDPKARTVKPEPAKPEPVTVKAPARGNVTPLQYGGDGWGDLPVQMRG